MSNRVSFTHSVTGAKCISVVYNRSLEAYFKKLGQFKVIGKNVFRILDTAEATSADVIKSATEFLRTAPATLPAA